MNTKLVLLWIFAPFMLLWEKYCMYNGDNESNDRKEKFKYYASLTAAIIISIIYLIVVVIPVLFLLGLVLILLFILAIIGVILIIVIFIVLFIIAVALVLVGTITGILPASIFVICLIIFCCGGCVVGGLAIKESL